MKKGKMLLILLFICLLSLVYYEFTHVYGTSAVYNIALPEQSGNINAGIDQAEVKKTKFKKLIEIDGWAYINDLQANQQKVYIVLFSKNKNYVYDTQEVLRSDLPAALNDQSNKVEYAGLKSLIDMSNVASGSYQIGFYIENGSRKELSSVGMSVIKDDSIVVFNEITNKKMDIKVNKEKGGIQANIEEVKKENGILKIKGWGFLEDSSSDSSAIYLVLKEEKSNQIIVFDTQMQIRKDVTAYYGNKEDLDKSGFIAKLRNEDLGVGKYNLGVFIKSGTSTGLYWSKESIGE